MSFSVELKAALADKHLLGHPFYQAWMAGTLSRDTLKDYAQQYYHHVSAFPRYISATHSICDNIEDRKLLTENLHDEELNGTDHPTLWMQFANGMGASVADVKNSVVKPATQALIDTFFTAARSSYAEGLCSLYTYEHQIPEIATSKIEGLKKNYDVHDKETLKFFTVHEAADIWHREQCETLIDRLPVGAQASAKTAAVNTANALWNFLSSVLERAEARGETMVCAAA